uniref:RNA-directed DNA polymerase n=1 Tax=Fopius arisanus TaxID=64838 RepID=A0A0C9RQ48_9HYME
MHYPMCSIRSPSPGQPGKLELLSSLQADGDSNNNTITIKECRLFLHDSQNHMRLLVDSGSVISIIPRAFAQSRNQLSDLKLYAANNTCINTYGQQLLTLNIGIRRPLKWVFVVADVKTAIIGADLLTHYGLMIDLKGHSLIDRETQLTAAGQLAHTSIYGISTIASADSSLPLAYQQLLRKYISITMPAPIPTTDTDNPVSHHIVTTGPPVVERPRRLTGEKLQAAKDEFDLLLQYNIIQPSSSQWASPLHMVRKKTGGWRSTGDFRRLNKQTVPDRYPIPYIEDLLQHCYGSKVFSTIDLVRAYHQMPVAKEDIPKTAVATPFGLFEFRGMPPGLRNATQTFQRHMDNLLRSVDFAVCFIDDIIVFSKDAQEHQQHVEAIFKILQDNHLSINPSKCAFGQEEVIFLGYRINKQGFTPPPDRVQAIQDFPKPQTISDLRRFLGMINYYRRCTPQTAQIQVPLNDLLKGAKKRDKTNINWTPALDEALDKCKQSIIAAVQAAFLSPTAPIALVTDASDFAIGAALEQLENGAWKPLGFFSRKLSPAETRYSTYDRELLAIFSSIKFFRHILDGRAFVIKTDHRPLVYAFSQRADKASPRQLNQLDFISQFTTNIIHVSGDDNVVADALSRINEISMPTVLDSETIQQAQESDDELNGLLQHDNLKLERLTIDGNQLFCDISTGFVRPFIPESLRKRAFDVIHGLAHPSGRVTSRQLKEKFIWPGIKKDALRWSRECLACQRSKIQRHNRVIPTHIGVPDNRFDHVHLDLIELPPVNNLRYCLTMIDRFSRWPVAVPLTNMEADTVATAFYAHWIAQFGTPLTISTDQGSQFESRLFTTLANMIGAHKVHTTPYHPQSNGMIERWHRTLKAALMCNAPTPWPDLLPSVLLGLRTCFKEDLKASPAQLLFGTELRIPGEFFTTSTLAAEPTFFLEKFREHLRKIRPTPTAHHTKARLFVQKDIYTCSHVFLRVDAVRRPLEQPYAGPYQVVKRVDDRIFIILINGTEKAVSVERLKPAFIAKDDSAPLDHQPAPNLAQVPAEHRSATMDPPLRTYQRTRKRVSFPDSPSQVTGGGVDVAARQSASSSPDVPPPPKRQRRKQELCPRQD